MTIKIRGIARGLKYISQIFAGKEQEMEIGYPTDVKHVAHIGLDGFSGNGPSWMKEFNTASNFSATSICNSVTTFSSQELERMEGQPTSEVIKDVSPTAIPTIPKKQKRKKIKSTSCQDSSSSSRSSRSAISKAKLVDNTKNLDMA